MKNFPTLHEYLMEGLANSDEAIDFLKVALEEYQQDGYTPFFLKSNKTVIEAQISISELAKRTHMSPDALQKIYSSNKSPHVETLGTILNELGCRLSVESIETNIPCSDRSRVIDK